MGGPMCQRLVATGFRVIAFDRASAALEAAVGYGAEAASNATDAASRCDVLLNFQLGVLVVERAGDACSARGKGECVRRGAVR